MATKPGFQVLLSRASFGPFTPLSHDPTTLLQRGCHFLPGMRPGLNRFLCGRCHVQAVDAVCRHIRLIVVGTQGLSRPDPGKKTPSSEYHRNETPPCSTGSGMTRHGGFAAPRPASVPVAC